MAMKPKRKKLYKMSNTDEQVKAMLKDACLWRDKLCTAANERGANFTSVRDIGDVYRFLWKHFEAIANAEH